MSFIPPNEKIIETKKCRISGQEFFVTDRDLEFYEKISPTFAGKKYLIPSPTLCPDERMRRRLSFRNERKLYHRKCNKTGNQIISIYSPDKPYTVYDQKVWWWDDWSPSDYGLKFDFNKSFFEQFHTLDLRTPKLSVMTSKNENCEYTHLTANNKDCYLIFESSNNQECYYGLWLQKSERCIDCDFIHESTNCYNSTDIYNCYNVCFSQNSYNCQNCQFINNCTWCKYCFWCINLQNKEYYIYNRAVSEKEYNIFLNFFIHANTEEQQKYIQNKKQLDLSSVHKYANLVQSENCIWDYMVHARNCFYCTHIHDAEDIKYGEHVWRNAKNIMDASTVGRNASWVYESLNVGIDVNNNLFCIQNWTSQETIYSSSCFNSQKLFWCSGIKKWKNCILNISYSQQEYDYICSRIINHMKNTGEWGEFFPHQLSHFWYNETDAYNHFPHLTEEEVKNHLWNWKEEEETNSYHGPYYNSLPIQEYSEKKSWIWKIY